MTGLTDAPISPNITLALDFGDIACPCSGKGGETPVIDKDMKEVDMKASNARLVLDQKDHRLHQRSKLSSLFSARVLPGRENQRTWQAYYDDLIQLAMYRTHCPSGDCQAGAQVVAVIAAAEGVDLFNPYVKGLDLEMRQVSLMGQGFKAVEGVKQKLHDQIELLLKMDEHLADGDHAKVTHAQLKNIREGIRTLPKDGLEGLTVESRPLPIDPTAADAFLEAVKAENAVVKGS